MEKPPYTSGRKKVLEDYLMKKQKGKSSPVLTKITTLQVAWEWPSEDSTTILFTR